METRPTTHFKTFQAINDLCVVLPPTSDQISSNTTEQQEDLTTHQEREGGWSSSSSTTTTTTLESPRISNQNRGERDPPNTITVKRRSSPSWYLPPSPPPITNSQVDVKQPDYDELCEAYHKAVRLVHQHDCIFHLFPDLDSSTRQWLLHFVHQMKNLSNSSWFKNEQNKKGLTDIDKLALLLGIPKSERNNGAISSWTQDMCSASDFPFNSPFSSSPPSPESSPPSSSSDYLVCLVSWADADPSVAFPFGLLASTYARRPPTIRQGRGGRSAERTIWRGEKRKTPSSTGGVDNVLQCCTRRRAQSLGELKYSVVESSPNDEIGRSDSPSLAPPSPPFPSSPPTPARTAAPARCAYLHLGWESAQCPPALARGVILAAISQCFAMWPSITRVVCRQEIATHNPQFRATLIYTGFQSNMRRGDVEVSRERWVGYACQKLLSRSLLHVSPALDHKSLDTCYLLRDGVEWLQQQIPTSLLTEMEELMVEHFVLLTERILPAFPDWPGPSASRDLFKFNGIACRNSALRIDVHLSDFHYDYKGRLRTVHTKLQAAVRKTLNLMVPILASVFYDWRRTDSFKSWHLITYGYIVSIGPHDNDQKEHYDYHQDAFVRNIVNAFIPLVPIHSTNSATRFKIGDSALSSQAQPGDVILMDNIVRHFGTRHTSSCIRPLVYSSFADRSQCVNTRNEREQVGAKTHMYNWTKFPNVPQVEALPSPDALPLFARRVVDYRRAVTLRT